jgi:DNA polymerase-4
VAAELRAEGVSAARVTLKLRFSDFRTITRSHTADPTQDGLELWRRAGALLAREHLHEPVRLIGISASSLRSEASGQLDLLDPNAVRRERLGRVVDRITRRFGSRALVPATLLPGSGPDVEARE